MRNGRLKTTEGERWLPRIETKSRKARPTSARKKKERRKLDTDDFTVCAVHQTLPFLRKWVWLARLQIETK